MVAGNQVSGADPARRGRQRGPPHPRGEAGQRGYRRRQTEHQVGVRLRVYNNMEDKHGNYLVWKTVFNS